MRKTYENVVWPEVVNAVDHARALGLLAGAEILPAGEHSDLDWRLTLVFGGFDAEAGNPASASPAAGDFAPGAPAGPIPWPGEDTGAAPSEADRTAEPEAEPGPEVPPIAADHAEYVEDVGDAGRGEGVRFCTKCGPEEGPKPISEFRPNANAKDGLSKVCKTCQSAMRRAANEQKQLKRREANPRGEAEREEVRKEFASVGRASHAPSAPVPETDGAETEGAETEAPKAEAGADAGQDTDVQDTDGRRGNGRPGGYHTREELEARQDELDAKEQRAIARLAAEAEDAPILGPVRERPPRVYCANGDDCRSPGIEGPAPLAPGKKEGELCFRCEERREKVLGRDGMPSPLRGGPAAAGVPDYDAVAEAESEASA